MPEPLFEDEDQSLCHFCDGPLYTYPELDTRLCDHCVESLADQSPSND